MQQQKDVIDCYDKTANKYSDKFINELQHKHFDSILLWAFALENAGKGSVIDLGCGPGQTTKFLFDSGITDITGVDISHNMIAVAKSNNPALNFEVADMLHLNFPDKYFAAAIAFYSIVHFDPDQIRTAFKEIRRVLKDKGQFLFSFHVGNDIIQLDNFLEEKVNIDFYFFAIDTIKSIVLEAGFEIIDVLERAPYADVEHASQRAYCWVEKKEIDMQD